MATLWVTQFRGQPSGGISNNGIMPSTPLRTDPIAVTAAASTIQLSSDARLMSLQADVPTWIQIGTSTAAAPTSTNAFRIPPNVAPILFNVSTQNFLRALST